VQGVGVRCDGDRLMERAGHVLRLRVVDGRLAAGSPG
jgi:hypothetical protein